jgi:hypothetical protein
MHALGTAGGAAGAVAMMKPAVMMPGAAGAGSAGMPAAPTGMWTAQSNLDASGNLIAPPQGQGYQIQTPVFDLAPGQEVYNCFHVKVPNDAVLPVGEWDAQMTAGSHHFILYRNDADTTASGTLTQGGCTLGFGGPTWLYTQGTPRSHLQFPDAVAMELAPHEAIVFDMHYINTTSQTIHARITLNINKVKAAQYQKASSQVSFNLGIYVPAHGTSSAEGDCTPVQGANYFIMQTHMHKFGTQEVINRVLANGQMGEEIVKTIDWDNPQAHIWQQAPFLTFQPGELFHYRCDYKNDTNNVVTVGTSAETNEMCMAEAYFFPAVDNVPGCT